MKNKIVLGSVTLLSALVLAACGNGKKKAPETTVAPTTEATTTAPTTTTLASSETKEVSLADTQRVGREDVGYFNVPKDWVAYKDPNGGPQFQYASKDSYNMITINGYGKDQLHVNAGETFGAELLANRLYEGWQYNPKVEKTQKEKTKFAGEDAFLINIQLKDGKYLFQWVFQRGEKVYDVLLEGTENTVATLGPILEQTWGLDSKTPGQ
ncbi:MULTISPECIES: hypothetical protein [unclassified Granulicatella]|uniref:hypothetical protein n=1 Tax=unclassified Granulicatella TaxID=2630493 RepID=UPI002554F465|nr:MULTISPECIES: hypothetical protein [unclassified Granulicatella]MDK8380324.1 hypothetical protein [Granulicatella sp. UMB5615B]MDK8522296.1 hypothetical protein [Granulicatella sp. UMB5615A]